MKFNLNNGVMFMEEPKMYVIPSVREMVNGKVSEEKLHQYISSEVIGDYSIRTKFDPINMPEGEAYEMLINADDAKAYINLYRENDKYIIKSGAEDIFKVEHPDVVVESESLWFEIKKDGNTYEMFYSLDGNDFLSLGKNNIESDITTFAGCGIITFKESDFCVKVLDMEIE